MKSKIGKITAMTLVLAMTILLGLNLVTPFVRAVPVGQAVEFLGAFTGPRTGYNTDDNVRASLDIIHGKVNPYHAFGTEYWVDAVSGSDTDDGLSPTEAFATITAAITASNLTAGSYNMNTIYIAGSTYTEDLTTLPKNCNVRGVGAKVRIQGNLTPTAAAANSRWWNIQIRENDALPIITLPAQSHGCEFHDMRLDDQGACTYGIYLSGRMGL